MTTAKVLPSAGALASKSTPMMLFAPGLLSTVTVCCNRFCKPICTIRAIWSVNPPGGYGTMIRIGLLGQAFCASSGAQTLLAAAATATLKRRRLMQFMDAGKFCFGLFFVMHSSMVCVHFEPVAKRLLAGLPPDGMASTAYNTGQTLLLL